MIQVQIPVMSDFNSGHFLDDGGLFSAEYKKTKVKEKKNVTLNL